MPHRCRAILQCQLKASRPGLWLPDQNCSTTFWRVSWTARAFWVLGLVASASDVSWWQPTHSRRSARKPVAHTDPYAQLLVPRTGPPAHLTRHPPTNRHGPHYCNCIAEPSLVGGSAKPRNICFEPLRSHSILGASNVCGFTFVLLQRSAIKALNLFLVLLFASIDLRTPGHSGKSPGIGTHTGLRPRPGTEAAGCACDTDRFRERPGGHVGPAQ
jgi:hypothetical protein